MYRRHEMTLEEARKNLIININDLSTVCQTQPSIYWEVSMEAVKAMSIRDKAKNDLDNTWSELYVSLKTEGGKLSDPTVKASVEIEKRYIDAEKVYLSRKREAEEWNAMKEAYQQRANMIKELCGLYVSGSFGEISVKGGIKGVYEKDVNEARKRMRG